MGIKRSLRSWVRTRSVALVFVGIIIGAAFASPASAHVGGTVSHLWTEHIKPLTLQNFYTKTYIKTYYGTKGYVRTYFAKKSTLSSSGTINNSGNPVDWSKLKNVPAGFADGSDADSTGDADSAGDISSVIAGIGLSGGAASGEATLDIEFDGSGEAAMAARSDHNHNSAYPTIASVSADGTVNTTSNPLNWSKLKNVPAGFADGTDANSGGDIIGVTTASGSGLQGGGTSGSVALALLNCSDGEFLKYSNSLPGWVCSPPEAEPNYDDDYLRLDGTTTMDGKLTSTSDSGAVFKGTYGSGTIPATGSGVRMMWYPKKAAFRAGRTTTGWDDTNIGDYSTASGYGTVASGEGSVAMGEMAQAIGFSSTAMGYGSIAAGIYSTALGEMTTASESAATALGFHTEATAPNSTSMGYATLASGASSTAIGESSIASGDVSTAGGYLSVAGGNVSVALGDHAVATADSSTALGGNTKAWGMYSTAMGNGSKASGIGAVATGYSTTASGNYSTAIGEATTASGVRSFAGGYNTTASGSRSVALGYGAAATADASTSFGVNTRASGTYSTAMGASTKASGYVSTATGYGTTASESYATAMGYGTTASNWESLATGVYTTASGTAAVSMGSYTTAQALGSLALGRYNVAAGSTWDWISTDPVLVVGNGSGAGSPSNAFTLLKNGNLTIAGTLTEASDARLKKNVRRLDKPLSRLLKLNGVTYKYKNASLHPGGQQIGMLAQDVQKVFPELVSKDQQGLLSIAYGNFSPIFVEAFKAQQRQISSQEVKLAARKGEIAALQKEIAALRREVRESNEALRSQSALMKSYDARLKRLER